jgi:transaldolase/glucose-6-phosphate isomerase
VLKHTLAMVRSCGPDVPPHENPGVQLGLAMGLAGLEGRDKVTILSSKKIADFGAWAEQLIAESTGKDGKGLIPIDGEPAGDVALYGNDRFFIDIRTESENDAAHDERLAALEKAGHPVVRIVMKSVDYIGQEFFRFEMATAVAGAVLGINPFNQPDVEDAKIKTRELTAAFEKTGALPPEKPVMSFAQADIFTDDKNAAALRKAGADGGLGSWLKAHLARASSGDYVALLAYIERNHAHIGALQHMRLEVRDKRHVATCAEFGPRFLHSTGQAYKGGPNSGVFLQITSDDAKDLAVPGQKASFGVIKAAQARGDFDVLTERGRRALRVHLKGDLESGLRMLDTAIANALN